MRLERRLELLDYAKQYGSWIVKDDYDSEFLYSDRALYTRQAYRSRASNL